MKISIALASLALVTSCGGALPPISPTLPPVSGSSDDGGSVGAGLGGDVPSGGLDGDPINTLTYNNGANNFSSVNKVVAGVTSFGQGAKADPTDPTSFEVIAFSDDGQATTGQNNIISATIIGSSTGSAAGFGQRAIFRRDSQSVLPTSGGGTFTGEYRGVMGAMGSL